MSRTEGLASTAVITVLRLALLSALVWAGWSVYRRLPGDDAFDGAGPPPATMLRVRLRHLTDTAPSPSTPRKTPVQLYPVDVESVEHEYESRQRPGVRLSEFIARRMGNLKPISGELNEEGEAVLVVPPGQWWVHATIDGPEELTWRLPVNVSGREKIVELTPDNIYTRARSF